MQSGNLRSGLSFLVRLSNMPLLQKTDFKDKEVHGDFSWLVLPMLALEGVSWMYTSPVSWPYSQLCMLSSGVVELLLRRLGSLLVELFSLYFKGSFCFEAIIIACREENITKEWISILLVDVSFQYLPLVSGNFVFKVQPEIRTWTTSLLLWENHRVLKSCTSWGDFSHLTARRYCLFRLVIVCEARLCECQLIFWNASLPFESSHVAVYSGLLMHLGNC